MKLLCFLGYHRWHKLNAKMQFGDYRQGCTRCFKRQVLQWGLDSEWTDIQDHHIDVMALLIKLGLKCKMRKKGGFIRM